MSEVLPRLSVLLLTEDSGAQADETLRTLVVKLLGRIAPGAVTRDDAQTWEPASPEARAVTRGNGWKNPRRPELVRFRQYIAAKLRQEHGFVFFHVDGDRAYRDRLASENLRKLEAMIRHPVRIILEHPPARRRGRRKGAEPRGPMDADQPLTKLVFLVPFYSIEAWLFQNTEQAARLCPGAPKCRLGCADKLARWGENRDVLDEVLEPKLELCFRDRHNAELAAAGFPLDEVLGANKSLHDAWQALKRCTALVTALEQQTPRWPPR